MFLHEAEAGTAASTDGSIHGIDLWSPEAVCSQHDKRKCNTDRNVCNFSLYKY